jgi:hypothetical protein
MDAVLSFVPGEDRVRFSAMTGQSLFYMGETDLAHKVLAVAEEEGAERAAYALKLLSSDGELSIASTGKDTVSGRLVTHTYTVTGPAAIFLTTTAVDVDEELLNRCLVLAVDEGRAQTRAIHDRQRAAQTLDGLLASAEADQVRKAAPGRPAAPGAAGGGEPARGVADVPGRRRPSPPRSREVPDPDRRHHAAAPAPSGTSRRSPAAGR